jgi:hypothetical protein
MVIDTTKAILSLGEYEFIIHGEIKSEQDWNDNVQFVSGADENGTAIFFDTKPVTYQQVLEKQAQLQAQEEQDKIDKEARIASAKAKLEALGLTTEEIKDTFGL